MEIRRGEYKPSLSEQILQQVLHQPRQHQQIDVHGSGRERLLLPGCDTVVDVVFTADIEDLR